MSKFYKIGEKVAGEVMDGEAVIMDLGTGKYFSSQNSGAFIWSCVEAGFSSDQIVESLASTYDLSSSDALTATTGFIDQLLANRLVEENSELTPATENAIPEKPAGSYELPELTVYEDMQDLLLLDPIHDTEDEGWPQAMPTTGVTKT